MKCCLSAWLPLFLLPSCFFVPPVPPSLPPSFLRSFLTRHMHPCVSIGKDKQRLVQSPQRLYQKEDEGQARAAREGGGGGREGRREGGREEGRVEGVDQEGACP